MEVFIIGSGESLKDFDYTRLNGREVIAVNKVIRELPHATYWLTADSGIASNAKVWTKNSTATKVLCYSATHKRFARFQSCWANFDVTIKYGSGNPTPAMGSRFGEFSPGQNSGFCALQFAVIMGYSPIYLLGFDLHGGHLYDTKKRSWPRRLDEFFENFKKGLLQLRNATIKVISCSQTSRLNGLIDYKSIDEVLT